MQFSCIAIKVDFYFRQSYGLKIKKKILTSAENIIN